MLKQFEEKDIGRRFVVTTRDRNVVVARYKGSKRAKGRDFAMLETGNIMTTGWYETSDIVAIDRDMNVIIAGVGKCVS